MDKKYLLVCEGQTDYFVINEISKSISNNIGRKVIITPLSPQQDATTGTWPQHGWTAIRNWCRLYGKKTAAELAPLPQKLREAALRKNWQALLKFENADGIILQIDADIAEQIKDFPAFDPKEQHRKEYLDGAIRFWLNDKNLEPQMYLAITSHALEAWIMATHSNTDPVFADLPQNFDYEEVTDVEARLIRLGYKSKRVNGTRRLSKKESLYKSYAEKVAENLETVRAKCTAANELCQHLEK
ncbi:TPA: hypothetical protein P7236_006262 [Pseudomonas aeruginosa]|uniref:hypothetical protein n=1 Tax=Pseudomonas aeruginosa TaxID=287 RepID=UPI00044AFC36|nr:hypothetical protein [Pseudomonas aeruginosa]ETV07288.1 hypothetical protein Q050_04896 [Pseudomonas aeruginosa BWHPSA045]EZN81746.1 hypothetical protein AJ68_06334 [Pseudomonas aeruginosa 3581]EZN82303.1 hypothetical protein AJ67_06362 [Pseudomonas aeruginosa 3580]EZO66400.1 hypothetical protein V560_03900 [Pseudomonas aeruginosa BWH059]MBA4911414.1 hypothetical protein [Pseudomonas aeruginosa]